MRGRTVLVAKSICTPPAPLVTCCMGVIDLAKVTRLALTFIDSPVLKENYGYHLGFSCQWRASTLL